MNTGKGELKKITKQEANLCNEPDRVFRVGETVHIAGKRGAFRVANLGRGEIVLKPIPFDKENPVVL